MQYHYKSQLPSPTVLVSQPYNTHSLNIGLPPNNRTGYSFVLHPRHCPDLHPPQALPVTWQMLLQEVESMQEETTQKRLFIEQVR